MAESSSATRIVPVGISNSSVVLRGRRQKNAEDCAARNRLAFDDAAMISDDLCGEGKTETRTASFGRHEGIENVRHQIRRHTCTVVANRYFQRQAQAPSSDGGTEANPRA